MLSGEKKIKTPDLTLKVMVNPESMRQVCKVEGYEMMLNDNHH